MQQVTDSWKPISQIADDVKSGRTKAVDNIKKTLQSIANKTEYNAIISTLEERAISRAEEIDKNPKGRLAGVPFIAKDNFLTLSGKTTAASNMLRPFEAPYQSTAIERLEAEGAICVAKANQDAWGHGGSTENSDFFTTKNPHDKTRVPGGSSGGSAAAVALGMAPFALGTDTGGSSRQPASFTGCVGFKPTYGLISRSGVIAMASSTDTVGTITKNIDDLALIVDVIAGHDELDSVTIERDTRGYGNLDSNDLKGKKFGLIKEYMGEGVEDGVKKKIQEAANKLKNQGAEVVDVSIPSMPLSLAVYYIVVPAEISSNLSRYDGQRYGLSVSSANSLRESYEQSREQGFGAEAKRRIMIGTYVLSAGFYDAYYKKAQLVRTKIINEFNEAFKKIDLMIGPVVPTTAFKIGERSNDPLKMYLADAMTVASSLTGMPAISVPAGEVDGLPVGLQIIAPQKADRKLLQAAKEFEQL